MANQIKSIRPKRVAQVLSGFFCILFFKSGLAYQQIQQVNQTEFSGELIKAYVTNDELLTISLIKEHRLLVKPAVNELIKECLVKELKGKSRESKQAFQIAEKTAASFEVIFGERSLSIGVNYLKDWSKEQKANKLKADSLYLLGTGLRGQEPERALEVYQLALSIYRNIGDERGEAEILGGFGLIFSKTDDGKSMSYYRQALTIREKVDDKQLIGNSLNSIGVIYNNSEAYSQAIPYLEKAEAVRLEIGDLSNLKRTQTQKATAYLAIGEELNNAGRFPESLKNLVVAFKIYQNLDDRAGIGNVLNQMGFLYSNLGDYTTAVEKISEAIKIMEELNDTSGLAGTYNHLGIVLQMSGRLEKALEYFIKSLKVYEEINDLVNRIAVLSNIGTLYFDSKDYIRAEEYLKKATQISREIKERNLEVSCLLNLANAQSLLGKLVEADSSYKTGLEIARSLNSPDLIWRFYVGIAEIFQKKGVYDKAVELNDSALKIIDGIRSTLTDEELKTSYMARERFVFEDIISMLERLYENDNSKGYDLLAFKYAELSKARVFLDQLAESQAKVNVLLHAEPATLEEVQALCPDKNTVFLEYSVGDSSTCLWVITMTDHHLFRLPNRKMLQEQIDALRFALSDTAGTNDKFIIRSGYSLYRQLIEPAEPYLTKKSRLVIIPDGILNYLPFEVLLSDRKDVDARVLYSDLPFLVKKYPVSYGQSGSVLKSLLTERTNEKGLDTGSKKLIAFGDPSYANVKDTSDIASTSFSRLEYSGKEVENIALLFSEGNADIYLNNEASEENVKKRGQLKKYNYVHFAAHGLIDEKKPDLSSIVLAQNSKTGEDGFLRASEIFNLDMNADLIVLSACQTGLGKLVRGEGMVGLTRAFMYAGTPAVMASLWSVSDISTATLMEEFYKNLLKKDLIKTDALRKAQLTLLSDEKFAHPFFWAPFVIFGDWR